jgi:2-haloacid dehalogenase
MDFNSVRVLTFDCYGTLIDWEKGILSAVRPAVPAGLSDERLLEMYGRHEEIAERPPFRRYRDVLRLAAAAMGRESGVDEREFETRILESFPTWEPFPDTVAALERLQHRFRLVITSNVDRDLFAMTNRKLKVGFDHIVTAEDVRSYKPGHAHWLRVLSDLSLGRDELVHVAQSLYHDHVPAKELGIRSVWINRRAGREGSGATIPAQASPDLTFPTLGAFADFLGL